MATPRTAAPLLAALLLPAALAAQEEVRLDFTRDSLPNGLTVIYHVDRSAPVAAVNVWYDVGSKHERPGRTGFAHLFEHMMFKGSRNVGDGEHFRLLEAAGGRAGPDINGTTFFDRTNYFEQVPADRLELALWLESDRMGTLLETLTPEKLENQQEVVKNERRSGVDNQPYGTWFEKMLAHAFPEGHPYHHSVIGSMEDLDAATVEDVRDFFRTYYAPNNAVLVVAGDIDVDAARAMVREHFGGIPRGPAVPPLPDMSLPERIGASPREVVRDPNAPAPAVYVGYRVPPAKDPRARAVEVAAELLAGGRSSPLFESLVRERQIATDVGGFNFGMTDGADLLVFTATGHPGGDPAELERALLEELDRAAEAIRPEEIERARASLRYSLVDGLQRTGGFGGRADRLAEGWTYYKDPAWVNGLIPGWNAVDAEELRALAAERLAPDNRVVLVYVPAGAEDATPGGDR